MTDTKSVLKKIEAEAQQNNKDLRSVKVCVPGDEIRQGDIYLYPVFEGPNGELLPSCPDDGEGPGTEVGSRQLAPGSSPGSRHVVEGSARVFAQPDAGPLDGPFVLALERITITHPEHAHISLPSGWYVVRYQRDYETPDDERESFATHVRRVID